MLDPTAMDDRFVNVTGDTMTGALTIDLSADAHIVFNRNSEQDELQQLLLGSKPAGHCVFNVDVNGNITAGLYNGIEVKTIDPTLYVKKAGDTMTGNLTMSSAFILLGYANGIFVNDAYFGCAAGGRFTVWDSTPAVVFQIDAAGNITTVGTVDGVDVSAHAANASAHHDPATQLYLSGGTMSGDINMGGKKITSLGTPSAAADAATKGYVDGVAAGLAIQMVHEDICYTSSYPTQTVLRVPTGYVATKVLLSFKSLQERSWWYSVTSGGSESAKITSSSGSHSHALNITCYNESSHTHKLWVYTGSGSTVTLDTSMGYFLTPGGSFKVKVDAETSPHNHSVTGYTDYIDNHTHTVNLSTHTHNLQTSDTTISAHNTHAFSLRLNIDGIDRTAALGGPWTSNTDDIDVSAYISAAGNHTIEWYDNTYQLRIMTIMFMTLSAA